MKKLLFGNEAIVQGALESGVAFASTYPGTPASEIGDLLGKKAKDYGLYFEYSTNEKVALEAAAGAAFSNVKSIVSMKHYGLNVALDSLMPLAYLSCPLVVVISDDPGCSSSVQTEQDSRWFSRLGKIPLLEPADSKEAYEMTKYAFEIAWKFKIPVIIRLTTRVCYSRSIVDIGEIDKEKIKKQLENSKFDKHFALGGEVTVKRHEEILKKISELKKEVEKSKFNFEENKQLLTKVGKKEEKIGIVVSGVSYNYVKEAFSQLGVELPLLKIGFSYPSPEEKIRSFVSKVEEVFVVEELDAILEDEVRKLTNKKVYGKNLLSEVGELSLEKVLIAFEKILNKKIEVDGKEEKVEKRLPYFCAGCPHRNVFYAVKKVLPEKIFASDIGCYMLGNYNPFNLGNVDVAMGAGEGIAHGISKVTGKKPVIFIGDSTFFHAGIPALINFVYNKADVLLIVLDNRYTAMTGHQPNPGTGVTGLGEETKQLLIEDIVKACQADFVKVSNVYNIKQLEKDLKEAYEKKGVSVLIGKGVCRLVYVRDAARKKIKLPVYEIFKQGKELDELENFGCPAIRKEKGKWIVDENLCWGCSSCLQLFPENIRVKKEEK